MGEAADVSVPRPWRATAFVVDPLAPHGRRREVAARAYALTRAGLDRFVARHEAAGHAVDVVEVLDHLDEIPATLPNGNPATPDTDPKDRP